LLQIDVETEKMFLEGHLKPERDDGPEDYYYYFHYYERH